MFLRTSLTATLAAVSASASAYYSSDSLLQARQQSSSDSSDLYVRASPEDTTGGHPAILIKRQSDAATTAFALVANPPQNETAWNEVTNAACIQALSGLTQATNPSGTCVCYNLPAIDTNTGVFQADLRLYKISDARDQFVGIPAENIQVGVSYTGASVSQAVAQQDTTTTNPAAAGRRELRKRADPSLLQTYTFVGQIDQEQMDLNDPMTMAKIEAIIMPVVTLTGSSGDTSAVSTNVSMNEAAFVVGVFSDQVVLSDTAMAQVEVDKQVSGLKNGTVVFQVPGVRIMIFPIGLVITSIWLALFVAAVGYGTIQRMKYREQFRRRSAQLQKGGMGTI
ncbi:hypothetical protein MKZ38_009364 [Zalerion maritima]|uniref:Uncharacterized protein n=1 Tax=Zalerion maritima TaxID=339359 RepID=A0AAD5WTJ6_9PEZI|nr:hypothetical protein MKZ38_009364 [Zalerion maritima]